MAEPQRPHHLFIVRFWHEPSQAATGGQWRGSVEHVPSGQRHYFAALNDLVDFIVLRIGPIGSVQADARDQRIVELEAQLAQAQIALLKAST